MSLNRQETRIEAARYAPSVSYNISGVAPTPLPTSRRPQYKSNIDIDFDSIAKSVSTMVKDAKKEQMNLGYNEYALKLDEIVEGQRQKVYSQDVAERLIRQETDKMIAKGYDTLEIAKIRDKYNGGLYNLEEQRQQWITKHETDRQLAQISTMREKYPYMSNWSDDKVAAKLDSMNKLQGDVEYFNNRIAQGNLTDQDVQALMIQRDMSFKDLAKMNMYNDLNALIQSPDFNPEQVDANTISAIKNKVIAAAVKNGIEYGEAVVIADRAADETQLTTLFAAKNRDITTNTDFMKKLSANVDATMGATLRSTTEGAVVMNLPGEVVNYLSAYNRDLISRFANQIFNVDFVGMKSTPVTTLMGEQIDNNYKETMKLGFQTFKANLADSSYPLSLLTNNAVVASKMGSDALGNVADMSTEDLNTVVNNADNMLNILNNPAAKAKRDEAKSSKDPNIKEAAEVAENNISTIEGKRASAELLRNPESKRLFNTLNSSLQANRLRIDEDTGNLVMVEDTEGFWQTAGDVLGSEGTRQELNAFNRYLERLPVEARKAAISSLSNGSIKPLGETEKVWDTSKQTTKESLVSRSADISTSALQGLERIPQRIEEVSKYLEDLKDAYKLITTKGNNSKFSKAEARLNAMKNNPNVSDEEYYKAEADLLKMMDTEEEEEEEVLKEEDPDKADLSSLNEYKALTNTIKVPSKESINISVDDLPAARDRLKEQVESLRSKMRDMDEGWEKMDTDKYIKLSSKIAQIERILNEE